MFLIYDTYHHEVDHGSGAKFPCCLFLSIEFFWYVVLLIPLDAACGCSHELQRAVAVAHTLWPAKPKIGTIWPFTERLLTPDIDR